MAEPIQLEENEQALRADVEARLTAITEALGGSGDADLQDEIRRLGAAAHALHLSLLKRDLEPKHHKYMVSNRGLPPRHPRFYEHVHPAEDLLKFIDDPDANDDPEDTTIGEEFEFRVYSRRWGHEDVYRVKRTAKGWHIRHAGIGGECNKRGEPYLYENFRQDSINYPEALPEYLEWLWEQASEDGRGLKKEELAAELEKLAKWVRTTEQASPEGVFGEFK